jgi:hypothetical protein
MSGPHISDQNSMHFDVAIVLKPWPAACPDDARQGQAKLPATHDQLTLGLKIGAG